MKMLIALVTFVGCTANTRDVQILEDTPDVPVERMTELVKEGRDIFRHDTFGDEAFWGDRLRLHEAIMGEALGGVGPGVGPNTALAVGLKVDMEALPNSVLEGVASGEVDLDAPATTVALLQANAVVGVTGFFDDGTLSRVGIQCALCHSTVDDGFAPGIGRRKDGWGNHDLDIGAIVALAPDLSAFVELLNAPGGSPALTQDDVRAVLNSWGPGKFDAQLVLDGKAFRPDGGSAATLIPDAFGAAGFNLHTWTGGWGTVTYWNAFVAVLEMHGVGNFLDERLDTPEKHPDIASRFPVAVANQLGHVRVAPEDDRVTSKLPALQIYQLALAAPVPTPDVHFDHQASLRGDEIFSGKANCASCHVEPLWTEPGWNAHKPEDIGIDSFQADRSPDRTYKTMKLSGLFIRELGIHMNEANKGRFYHDGRFQTLHDVVDHYDQFMGLGLTDGEKDDLVEYLKSL